MPATYDVIYTHEEAKAARRKRNYLKAARLYRMCHNHNIVRKKKREGRIMGLFYVLFMRMRIVLLMTNSKQVLN